MSAVGSDGPSVMDFWAMLWGDERHWHQVCLYDDGRPVTCWVPCHHQGRLTRLLDAPDAKVSPVPRFRRFDDLSYGPAHILWAYLQKPADGARLKRFRPSPTLIWRDARSSRRWAAWALSRPLPPAWITQATERLAHSLGGLRRAASPQGLIDSPFTGRWSPEFFEPITYTAREIVGHLRDAPARDSWKRAA